MENLFIYLFIYLFICLFIYLFIYLFVQLFIYLLQCNLCDFTLKAGVVLTISESYLHFFRMKYKGQQEVYEMICL